MAKVIINVKGFTHKDVEIPVGVPIEADAVLSRLADKKERRDGVVAVVWAEETPIASSPVAEVSIPPVISEIVVPDATASEPDRKEIMAKLKEKGIKFFAGAKTEDLLAKLKEAGE